eukprot:TRINITY_DN10939_c0_g1_i1.p1 TRINITY_DN10939_c0_g1~~TRINITY_DN10939_c0_g1_i1.p1  ORF type:complete len:122 (-),score=8.71 TRINITY_DN10939_c0_g1_i1:118-435(-)
MVEVVLISVGFYVTMRLPDGLKVIFLAYSPTRWWHYLRSLLWIFHIVWMGLGVSWIVHSGDCSSVAPKLFKLSIAMVSINLLVAMMSLFQCLCCACYFLRVFPEA